MAFISQPTYSETQLPSLLITAADSFWGSRLALTYIHHQYQIAGLHNPFFRHTPSQKTLSSFPAYQQLTSSSNPVTDHITGVIFFEIYLAQTHPKKFSELQADQLYYKFQTTLNKLSRKLTTPYAVLASYRQLQPHKLNPNYKFSSFLFQSTLKHLVTNQIDYRVIFIEDLVSPKMSLSPLNPLHQLIQSIRSHKKSISLDTNYRVYPLEINDTAHGITRALFSPGTQHKNFLLAGNPISLSTVATRISSQNTISKKLKLRSSPRYAGVIDEQLIHETRYQLKWKPTHSSAELLTQLITPNSSSTRQQSSQIAYSTNKNPQTPPSSTKIIPLVGKQTLILSQQLYRQQQALTVKIRQHHPIFFKISFFLAFILIIPFLLYSFYLGTSLVSTYQGYQALNRGEWKTAQYHTNQAQQKLQIISSTQPLANRIDRIPLSGYLVRKVQTQVPLYQQTLTTLNHAAFAGEEATTFLKSLLVSGDKSLALTSFSYLKQLPQDLSLLETRLPQHRPLWLFPLINKADYQQYRGQLPVVKKSLQQLVDTTPIFKALTATAEPQIFAVLLQNNRELRPTGGFIGSFALLNFQSGTLTEKKVYDVYDADGQLKGYVKPPQPIEKYLGEASWFLRDANWDPDFPTTAERVQWFLQKELNISVNAVIALDLDAISNILAAVGPLSITEIPTPITDQNIFQYLQTEIETDFFPGSHRKRFLLTAITEALISQLKNADRNQNLALATALKTNIQQKHLQVWFQDPELQQYAVSQQWSGALDTPQISTDSQVYDQIQIIEANLGVNKVNHFISRTTQHTIDFSSGDRVEHILRINYYNSSREENKLQGTYKNYLRAYIPPTATFDGALLLRTSTEQTLPEVKVYVPEPIDTSQEHGWQVNGFLVTVPPGGNATIDIKYSIPLQATHQVFSYHLDIPKQAGLQSDPYSFKIISGSHYSLTEASHILGDSVHSLTPDTILTYNTELSADQQLILQLETKF